MLLSPLVEPEFVVRVCLHRHLAQEEHGGEARARDACEYLLDRRHALRERGLYLALHGLVQPALKRDLYVRDLDPMPLEATEPVWVQQWRVPEAEEAEAADDQEDDNDDKHEDDSEDMKLRLADTFITLGGAWLKIGVEELKTALNEPAETAPALVAKALDAELGSSPPAAPVASSELHDLMGLVKKKKKNPEANGGVKRKAEDDAQSEKKAKLEKTAAT
ncbi:hypothetical protein BD413DRAFT_617987 [Trametes elegans]|nr:hypothetical protein BD413DRAFT_617987 [Trametes elegans]